MTETPKIQDEMPRAYEPGQVEQKWYRFWLEKGYFKPAIDPDKEPFVIIMPPSNLTGEAHIGHALTATLEDIMVRWHRMQGEPTLWLPGVDHASIAAHVVMEQMLAEEGVDRFQLGREKFLERIRQWAEDCRQTINEQYRRLGASCDWDRERFTMDPGSARAVLTTFVRLYHKGLIYRGERIINWCPRCGTAVSDLEVDHQDLTGSLYYVRYPLAEGDGYITVATTRPETILGDTAVAVNPEDERFKNLIGKKIRLPAVNREIPIIADQAVDPSFGTGAVKITPAHDPVDFDVAQRHDLPLVNILNPDATMNQNAGPYSGLDRFVCREKILEDLEKDGLLEKIEPYGHAVGHCERCKTVIEPVVSMQWWVNMKPLAEPAIDAVVDGRINIIPARFTRVYLNWMENIRDWCISRQLWWGHRIPVWYCRDCGQLTVAVDEPEVCSHCNSSKIEQDPDVLDTWFSSALWPHSTLGWPDDTEDLHYFYPTTVMETAYDILFFWVARMIMMAFENTGEIPFRTVYLHGLIRDEEGEKMSKTKGNVLNPVDLQEQYGTDALRFALITGTSAGNDSKPSTVKLEAGRNFANKLWNATRFVVKSIEGAETGLMIQRDLLPTEDRWIISRFNNIVETVTRLMQAFQFAEAQRYLYDFLWGEFCDWYIELAKIRLRDSSGDAPSPLPVLVHVLDNSLRLLHPFMPFVTEELWQNLKRCLPGQWPGGESIMVAPYPQSDGDISPQAERVITSIIDIIRAVRNTRAQYNVDSGRWIEVQVYGGELAADITRYSSAIQSLSRAKPLHIYDTRQGDTPPGNAHVQVLAESDVVIAMESMLDLDAERKRLQKEIAESQTEVSRLETMLDNEAFVTRAPPAVVDREREKLVTARGKLERLQQQLDRIRAQPEDTTGT